MHSRRFALYGAVSGLGLPVIATVIEAFTRGHGLSLGALARAQATSPILWIVDTAPFFLGALASLAGRAQDELIALESARRDGYLKTASELFTAAQALLATVSSFSSTSAETAASVRETTQTMGLLGQSATQTALSAETVIGLAHQGEKASVEGLAVVDTSLGEMMKLADEVRTLSQRIDRLNARMREVFEIAAVVGRIAEGSDRIAGRAAEAARGGGAAVAELVGALRGHAEEAKRSAAQVRTLLADVHEAMHSAMSAAEVGVRRAEQGAAVASSTGETIRRLATALRDSSRAARSIATVAQQQDQGIDQVLKAMNEIFLATEETMASTHAVATEARALNDLASGLKRAVGA
jgi:methyl-accepting chemotaxis protein